MRIPYKLVEARHGRYLLNPNDYYIGRGLIEYGEYAEAEWQVLHQLLLPSKDVVEVGANIGALSVPVAKRLDEMGRRLLAVEPQPLIFQNLCANLALNGLCNVQTENLGVSNSSVGLSFLLPDYQQEGSNFGGISLCEDNASDNVLLQRVNVARLDDIVPNDFDVGLIKIDVEGYELKVLESAVKTIARHRPLLYLENDRVELSQALIKWLWEAGYRLYWHQFQLFNPDNYRRKKENLFLLNGLNVVNVNMLALPSESVLKVVGLPLINDCNEHPLRAN